MVLPPKSNCPGESLHRAPYTTIAFWFVLSRLFIIASGWAALRWVKKGEFFRGQQPIIEWFNAWDSAWYLDIATQGYNYSPQVGQNNVAFFPLFPWLIHVLVLAGTDGRFAGYLVSNLSLFFGAIILWKLTVQENGNRSSALLSVLFLFFGPLSFFFSIIYTESLFFFLTVSSLYCARSQRWVLAGICGYLAALTRAYGVLLMIPLVWELVRSPISNSRILNRLLKWGVFCLLPSLGLLTFVAFLWWSFDEPLAFQKAQAGWQRKIVPVWVGFANALHIEPPHSDATGYRLPGIFFSIWFLAAFCVGAFLIILGFCLRLRTAYLLWMGTVFSLVVSSTTFESLPRYISGIFPVYVVLGFAADKWPRIRLPLIVASCCLLAMSVFLFVNGYWFT